jgi:hypothetical protein
VVASPLSRGLTLVAVALLAGCGGADAPAPRPRAGTDSGNALRPPVSGPSVSGAGDRTAPMLPRARCPAGVVGCRTVRGPVIYVERVDPDGDGDLHVVVAAGSVTLRGLTAVDVARELRPKRDPRVGDRVSAAGPVQRGSFGQSQIHALEFHVRRG